MFTQSCFIRKISKELSKKLESLGYKLSSFVVFASPDITATYCKSGKYAVTIQNPALLNAIDCGTNEELFLALAALRDDTDSDQWFILDYNDTWPEAGDFRSKGDFAYCNTEKYYCGTDVRIAHKATPEELIKHFNHE